jgi:DNA-binding CsgD family transcriptional regulator
MARRVVTALPLLERAEELARVDSALERARDGRGAFVVLEGPAGIGKTALLGAVRASADAAGMRVLRSRGAELERDFGFGVVRQLFEPALAEAADAHRSDLLQGPAGVAGALLGLPGAADDRVTGVADADASFAVLHGLYWLCANLAAGHPICLIVDDAHWADVPSLRYLSFLLTRLEEISVALVVAARPREPGAHAELLAALTTEPSAEVVRLAPLTRAAVGQYVEAALGGAPDPVFVDACLRATRGTPFLLRELALGLAEAEIAPTAGNAGRVERIGAGTVGRSIALRLRRLPTPARRLAKAAAVLERGSLLHAAALADLDQEAAARAADVLVAAGILEHGRPLTFVHPIIRTGIYGELESAERSGGHLAAARLLASEPGAGERVAEHLLLTEPAADPWVVERLVEAARAAAHSGAPESAAAFLRRVVEEPPPEGELAGLLLELGMVEASAGQPEWQEHLQAAVDGAADDESRTAAALVLALALSRSLRAAEAVEVLDRAAARLDPAAADFRQLLETAAVGAGMNNPVTAPAVYERRRAARERAGTDPDAPPELLALAAFIAVLSNEPADAGAELALRALEAGRVTKAAGAGRAWFSYATWFSQSTVSLLWAERFDEVRPLLDGSIAEARATGDSARLAVGLAHRGWLAFRRGDLAGAEGDVRNALAAAALPAPALYRVLNGGILVGVLIEQGGLDEADELVRSLGDDAEAPTLTAAVLRHTRGRLRIAQLRLDEGVEDLLAVGALATRAGVTCPSFLPWRSEAGLALHALGRGDEARRLAEEELALARAFGAARALGIALRAAGVIAGGREGEALLREAVDSFERGGARIERARALTDLGALIRRANRRSEARALLRQALDAAHHAGAATLAARAETELRATGARPRRAVLSGLESLTASERRVAELASQELTNREIAQTLFVTTRTVEGHLTSVFRKLQLDSREELPAALGRAPVSV